MKPSLRILYFLMILSSLSGCKSQSVLETDHSSVEHLTALAGIENRAFRIEAYEFRIPEKNLIVAGKGSYLSIKGEDMLMQYSADVPLDILPHLRRQEGTVQLERKEKKKNGNTVLLLSLKSKNARDKTFTVTLYAGGNDCWVQCRSSKGHIEYDLKGEIYPLTE